MLELKSRWSACGPNTSCAYNRTMLELKSGNYQHLELCQFTYNRTMLELKSVTTFGEIKQVIVLIIVQCLN